MASIAPPSLFRCGLLRATVTLPLVAPSFARTSRPPSFTVQIFLFTLKMNCFLVAKEERKKNSCDRRWLQHLGGSVLSSISRKPFLTSVTSFSFSSSFTVPSPFRSLTPWSTLAILFSPRVCSVLLFFLCYFICLVKLLSSLFIILLTFVSVDLFLHFYTFEASKTHILFFMFNLVCRCRASQK